MTDEELKVLMDAGFVPKGMRIVLVILAMIAGGALGYYFFGPLFGADEIFMALVCTAGGFVTSNAMISEGNVKARALANQALGRPIDVK